MSNKTATVQPQVSDEFTFPKHLFENIPFVAGMDKGCSLVKILYQAKPSTVADDESTIVKVICETYLNADFHDAVDNFLERAYLPAERGQLTLNVTGGGCEMEMKFLEEKTGMKVKFVEEFYCQAKGAQWLITNGQEEDLFYPEKITIENLFDFIPKTSFYLPYIEILQDLIEEKKNEFSNKLPAVVAFMGSATLLLHIPEDEKLMKFAGFVMMGGKTFLSLAKLLLSTGNYGEIVSLAEAGDCRNVDTQVGEMFVVTNESAYGEFDGNDPLFHFGKAIDQNRNLDTFNKEDVAASLVKMFADTTATATFQSAHKTGFHRLYFGGNVCRAKLFRDFLLKQMAMEMVTNPVPFEVRLIKTGHTGAFGAFLAPPGQENKLY